jgi:type I restriction enzyme S subunit
MKAAIKQTELGAIPEAWDVTTFGTLFAFTNGINADKTAYGKGIPFINVLEPITYSHIFGPEISGRVQISGEAAHAYLVKTSDIVFNRTSETDSELGLAAVYLGDERVVFGGFVIRGRPITDALDPKYSGYALRAKMIRSQIVSMGQGAVRANIGQQNLKRVLIPVPPKREQQAIAQTLGDVDDLIAAQDRLIVKKRDIKKAAVQQLLTGRTRLPGFSGKWEVKRIGEIGSTYGGLTGKTKADFGHGSGRYVTFMNVMSNVAIDCGSFEQVRILPGESQNQVKKSDLLFNGSSETPEEVAMCSLMTSEVPNLFLNSFCFGFRLREERQADGLFLAYYLRATPGREVMKSLAQGSTRYNLSKSALLNASIRLPLKAEQTAIAAVLSDMDKELSALESRRDKTRALKQGMMQELLTGKTRLI